MGKLKKFEDAGAIFTEDCGLPRTDRVSIDVIEDDPWYDTMRYPDISVYGRRLQCRLLPYGAGSGAPNLPYSDSCITRKDAVISNSDEYTIMFRWHLPMYGEGFSYPNLDYYALRCGVFSISYTGGHNGAEYYSFNDTYIPDINTYLPGVESNFIDVAILTDTVSGSFQLYVDGQSMYSELSSVSPTGLQNEVKIGFIDNIYDEYLTYIHTIQEIADVVIFDRYLTEDEIVAHNNNKLIDYDLNMIHSYDFDNLTTLYNKGLLETGLGEVTPLSGMGLDETVIGTGINSAEVGDHIIEFNSQVFPTGDSKPFTLTTWIRLDDNTSSTQQLFSNFSEPDGEDEVQGFDSYIGGGKKFVFRHRTYDTGSNFWLATTDDFPIKKLTHVAVTWDGTLDAHAAKLYIDGVFDGSDQPEAANIHESVNDLNMFCKYRDDTTSNHLGGTVTNMKVFDKALNPSEIKHLYTTDLRGVN